jgi:predicted transcriptional regulator YdeE
MEPRMVKKEAVKLAGFVLKTTTKDGENKREIPKFWQAYMTDGRMEKLHGESFIRKSGLIPRSSAPAQIRQCLQKFGIKPDGILNFLSNEPPIKLTQRLRYRQASLLRLAPRRLIKSHAEFGVCFFEDPENGELVYVIGVEAKEGHDIPGGYHVCTIPEALYAVFTTPPADESNFTSSIQETWTYIYSEWFSNSGYEFDRNGLGFEFYDERCMVKTGKVIDIYIPVVKKSGIEN